MKLKSIFQIVEDDDTVENTMRSEEEEVMELSIMLNHYF